MRPCQEKFEQPRQGTKMSLGFSQTELLHLLDAAKGKFIIEMRDGKTGEVLLYLEKENVITLDAGILCARLFSDSMQPNPGQNNGLTMLGVGTGATGALLAPDAPQPTQRKLNAGHPLGRKPFSSVQYRNANGIAVAYPTNIVDFTTTYTESEAVGALNEMALMCTYSLNPAFAFWQEINNGPTNYDPTIDVTGKDIIANYLTFPVISKPNTAVLSISWRLSF